jgi:DNA-directed RNA polymerase sigma subunit (sigma70/sigma32)
LGTETRDDRVVIEERHHLDVTYSAPYAAPDAFIDHGERQARVQALLDAAQPALSTDERCCLRLYYGLVDGVEHTLTELATPMNVSRVRARSLKDSALKKLKRGAVEWTQPLVRNTLASAEWKVRNGARHGR